MLIIPGECRYTLLGKPGVRSVQALLMNSLTGIPDRPEHYARLLCGGSLPACVAYIRAQHEKAAEILHVFKSKKR